MAPAMDPKEKIARRIAQENLDTVKGLQGVF